MGIPISGPPPPIDRSYKPAISIARISADAPFEDILNIIERDGGVIVTGFATAEEVAAIDSDVDAYRKRTRTTEKSALHIIPKETLAVPGLVGKSPTVAKLCEAPLLEKLRTSILQDNFSVIREDVIEENTIDPLLSISITFYIGHGAPRQRLHRDDNVHGIRHAGRLLALGRPVRTARPCLSRVLINGMTRDVLKLTKCALLVSVCLLPTPIPYTLNHYSLTPPSPGIP
jgi:swainsonine biosynthesis dioxygenase SwnH1/2